MGDTILSDYMLGRLKEEGLLTGAQVAEIKKILLQLGPDDEQIAA